MGVKRKEQEERTEIKLELSCAKVSKSFITGLHGFESIRSLLSGKASSLSIASTVRAKSLLRGNYHTNVIVSCLCDTLFCNVSRLCDTITET